MEYAATPSTDSTELLGSFEQASAYRPLNEGLNFLRDAALTLAIPALLARETQGQGLGQGLGLANEQGLGLDQPQAQGLGLEGASPSFRAAAVVALSAVHRALALASAVEVMVPLALSHHMYPINKTKPFIRS